MSKQWIRLKRAKQGGFNHQHDLHSEVLGSEITNPAHNEQAPASNAEKRVPINPKGEMLTPETLRTFPGCEQHNDEEAMTIIESLMALAKIIVRTIWNSARQQAPKSQCP